MIPEKLQPLFEEVQKRYTMPIEVVIDGPASGVLTHAQSHQELLANDHLQITVSDTTNVDYTLSHELLHMRFTAAGFPPLQFHLASGDPDVDQQFFAVATALYDAALHGQIKAWQQKLGLWDEAVEKQLTDGYVQTLGLDASGLSVFRTLTALDACVMIGTFGDWTSAAPEEAEAAQQLYMLLQDKPLGTPFAFRRAVVKLWRQFDNVLTQHGYQATLNDEFATLPPVLSERQLRLAVNQTYEIRHSAMRDRTTKHRAYVAQAKGDGQNAFVLPLQSESPEAFQDLYRRPLKEVLDQYQLDYTIRE